MRVGAHAGMRVLLRRASPIVWGVCHCIDCRKHHGALFYAAAIFPQHAVKLIGDTQSYNGRFFCLNCGSSVYASSGDEIELHLGAMDVPDQFEPTYECWTIRREKWLSPIPRARQFVRDRDERGEA